MQRINTRFILLIFTAICVLFFQDCNVINPPEKTPTYIHIDSVHVNINPYLTNVSASSNITCIWVYYNENPIGTFDLPATIPVMTTSDTGVGQLQIAPGIAVDGLNNLLGVYPFYRA